MNNQKNSYLKISNHIGLFLVVLFTICFLWYYIQSGERGLHIELFKMAYFGFNGMKLSDFILGAIQTYFWAYIFVAVYYLVKKVSKIN